MHRIKKLAVVAMLAGAAQSAVADEALVEFKIMSLVTAQKLAQATLEACRKEGFQTAVAVVDRFGNMQVLLRDRFAGAHTPETARRKAWTAVSFRSDTVALDQLTKAGMPQAGAREIPGALMLGGGVPVEAAGSIVGGVGVSGGPGGEADHACAEVGIAAVQDDLEF